MRKYQQLLLVIISAISLFVLLLYRQENSKLRYVLEVVNFFGSSSSVSMVRMEKGGSADFSTQHIFDSPAPIWTRLGDDFHAYSAHWHKQPYTAGGEVVVVAVGLQRSLVKFRCSLRYENGTSVNGLFSYTRVELSSGLGRDIEHYHVYKFLCKVNKDFDKKGPRLIVFHDTQSGSSEHFVHVNDLTPVSVPVQQPNGKTQPIASKSTIALCVDFIPYNITKERKYQANVFTDKEILQYFLHHGIIGIHEFIIYEANNFPAQLFEILQHQGIHITKLSFNFPYELGDALKISKILELDCLLRTSAHIKFVLLTRMNEYFLPPTNIRLNRTFVQSLEIHPDNINRFELPVQTVCQPETSTGAEMKTDFHMYDADSKNRRRLYVYRPTYELLDNIKHIEASPKTGLVHRYSKQCYNSINLKDWRETLSPEHLHFVEEVGKELKGLLV